MERAKLLAFARIGAAERIAELTREIEELKQIVAEPPKTVRATLKHNKAVEEKKPHWASTPEGRKKLSRRMKKYWREVKAS